MANAAEMMVVVPTFRRFHYLRDCLMALDALNDTIKFSIFVADNSLQKEISENFRASLPAFVHEFAYEILDRSGTSYAKNYALERCHAPYIASIDDDAFVDQGWVDAIIAAFKKHHAGAVGGKILPFWEAKRPDWLDRKELLDCLAVLDWGDECRAIIEPDEWLVGASIAYDAQALRDVGGFNETIGRNGGFKGGALLCHEELDVIRKIAGRNRPIIYCGKATSKHIIQRERVTQSWFCENAFWEGISHYIHKEKLDISCFSEHDFAYLAHYCEQMIFNRSDTNNSQQLLEELYNFRSIAIASFKKLVLHGRNTNNLGAIVQLAERLAVMESKHALFQERLVPSSLRNVFGHSIASLWRKLYAKARNNNKYRQNMTNLIKKLSSNHSPYRRRSKQHTPEETTLRQHTPEEAAFYAASTDRALQRICRRGLQINTVIDVGASNGSWTKMCMGHFPQADFLLVEANQYHANALGTFCEQYSKVQYVMAAAGEHDGTCYFDGSDPFGGGAFLESHPWTDRAVAMISLDEEIKRKNLSGSFLLKLDTHGFELPILRGAQQLLQNTGLAVIETYTFRLNPNALLFYELCAYMDSIGFGVIDFSEPLWRAKDMALWQYDLFFAKKTIDPALNDASYL